MNNQAGTFQKLAILLDPFSPAELLHTTCMAFDPQDWSDLAELAKRQKLSARLFQTLIQASPSVALPADLREQLRGIYLQNATRNLLILHQTGLLLHQFQKQRIDTIVLKGVYMAEHINRGIAERNFGDIDLLVKRSDLSQAIRCAQSIGFQPSTYFASTDLNTEIKHVPPMFNGDGLPLEIHWTLLEEDEPFSIDIEDVWQRAMQVKVAGTECLALCPEDLLGHLCLHFSYQHSLDGGLKGLLDVADVLWKRNNAIDWLRFLSLVKTWQSQRVVWLTFSLLKRFSLANIPDEVLSALLPDGANAWVIDQARAQVMDSHKRMGDVTPALVTYSQSKNILSRIKIGLSRVFVPQGVIARLYQLNPNSPLILKGYYFRLRDLIRMYGKHLLRAKAEPSAWSDQLLAEQARLRLRSWLAGSDASAHNN